MFFSLCWRGKEACRPPAIEDVDHATSDCHDESVVEMAPNQEFSPEWLARTCQGMKRNDPHLDEIEIDPGDHDFGDDQIMELAESLRNNQTVSRLVLRNMEIGKCGSSYLIPMLKNTKSIRTLYLEDTRGEGQIAVATALSLNAMSSIQVLHLKGNLVDNRSAEALRLMLDVNTSLTELRLCHNLIGKDAAAKIAQGLKVNKGLKVLDLLGNGMDDACVQRIARALKYNTTLEFLCLDFNDFGYYGVQAIAEMIAHNSGLEELHLFGNRIDAAGAECLAAALRRNKALKTLILSFNHIGDRGAKALASALTVNTTLTKLWFPSNSVGNDGLSALGECMPKMKGLEQLNVGDFFDNSAAEVLLEGLKLNTKLSVLYMESPVYDNVWMEKRLDFYLRLNRSGRSLLHDTSAPSSLWASALARASWNDDDGSPDALYYLLREKPDLFDSRH